jgi:predicted CxxxxCH...CXXCH cytochrome family protein
VTPQQLAQQAWSALRLPLPDVRTAPPRASAGLVGLPEWAWVPRGEWAPISERAVAGAVWAEVTATPQRMSIKPGAGLAVVECSGPGTAYDPGRPASVQRTDCSYTYRHSSAAQPGAAYRVTVTVVWGGTWAGSDGSGGTLPDISRSTTFSLRVAEGQGLYG